MGIPAYISKLPSTRFPDLFENLQKERQQSEKITIILDDDPTGCQTVHDVPVLLSWGEQVLKKEIDNGHKTIFILTNSRSLNTDDAVRLNRDIGHVLKKISASTGCIFSLISRSDSTLRGHYPAEPQALHFLYDRPPVHCIIPAFFQGGRVTANDIHYVIQGDEWIPAAETPFAGDKVFGFGHSNLTDWVEEKTSGEVKAGEVVSFSIDELRRHGPDHVEALLLKMKLGQTAIVNALEQNDLDIFALGALKAEKKGAAILYRTAASMINSYCAIEITEPLPAGQLVSGRVNGGLIIAGSYVPKTTAQLERLTKGSKINAIEVNVKEILGNNRSEIMQKIINETDKLISSGEDVLIYTSRELVCSENEKENLTIGRSVSDFLVEAVRRLKSTPGFVVAKGGITSHDIASRGLGIKRALVAGQALPGVPVWSVTGDTGREEMKYMVFPGNVGGDDALLQLYDKLTS